MVALNILNNGNEKILVDFVQNKENFAIRLHKRKSTSLEEVGEWLYLGRNYLKLQGKDCLRVDIKMWLRCNECLSESNLENIFNKTIDLLEGKITL